MTETGKKPPYPFYDKRQNQKMIDIANQPTLGDES